MCKLRERVRNAVHRYAVRQCVRSAVSRYFRGHVRRYKGESDAGRWVTINGAAVFIEGGKVTKGPKSLTGKKLDGPKEPGRKSKAGKSPAALEAKRELARRLRIADTSN